MLQILIKFLLKKKNMIFFINQVAEAATFFENKSFIEFNNETILLSEQRDLYSNNFLIKKNIQTSNLIIANNIKKYVFFILLEETNKINNKNKASYSEIKFYQEYLVVKNNSNRSEIIFFSDFIKKESLIKMLCLILKRDFSLLINVILLFNCLIFCLYKLSFVKIK